MCITYTILMQCVGLKYFIMNGGRKGWFHYVIPQWLNANTFIVIIIIVAMRCLEWLNTVHSKTFNHKWYCSSSKVTKRFYMVLLLPFLWLSLQTAVSLLYHILTALWLCCVLSSGKKISGFPKHILLDMAI